jgi:nitrogen fixation NifU-like protein
MDGNLWLDRPFKIAKLTGPLDPCDGHAKRTGSCGDTMEFWLQAGQRRITRAAYQTDGCGATKACGDMAAALATGRQLEEVLRMTPIEILDKLPGLSEESHHCAYLALETLQAACREIMNRRAAAGTAGSSEAGRKEDCSAKTPGP